MSEGEVRIQYNETVTRYAATEEIWICMDTRPGMEPVFEDQSSGL